MHEPTQRVHDTREAVREPEEQERPWSEVVHGMLDDQFREFAEEADQPQSDERPTSLAPDR